MLLEDKELQEMIEECKIGTCFWRFGDADDEDNFVYGVHLFFTLYFYEEPTLEKRTVAYDLCERFVALTESEIANGYKIYFGRGGVHKLGAKYGQIRGKKENDDKDRAFFLKLTSAKKPENSARFYFDALINEENVQQRYSNDQHSYSTLRVGVPLDWFQGTNRQALLTLLEEAANCLGARQGYGGFGWALPMNNHVFPDFEATEHYFAHQFYGFDIDKPFYMCQHSTKCWSIEKGLRAPGWLTFVGDDWLAKLGGAVALTEQLLTHPEVQVHPYQGGIMIQAGESPQLYPVDEGLPSVMTHIAELLKPVRPQTLNLLSYARWDGDEEMDHVFFDLNKSARWLARFDKEGDWPTPEQRFIKPESANLATLQLRGLPGETVPQTGQWWSPAFQGASSRRHFNQGDHFPDTKHTDYGAVVWYLEN